MKNELKNIFCTVGIILIIIGFVFSLLHFNIWVTYITISIGILLEAIYKIMSAKILKERNESYIREYIFAAIYVVFIGVLWLF